MATKSKRPGLGEPNIEGAEALFQFPQPPAVELENKQDEEVPKEKETENRRVKKNFFVLEATVDLLDDLRKLARKRENRSVSYGNLVDRAVYELAQKMRGKTGS